MQKRKKLINQLTNQLINSHGFTLVEMLVASAIFIIIVTIVTSIFAIGVGSQRKITREVNIQQEAQMIMEIMSKKIRKSLIDYDYSYTADGDDGIIDSEIELVLKDPKIIYRLNNKVLEQSIDGGNTWYPITMTKVEIKDLDFYIYPSEDPFNPENPQNIQPRVTIVMKITSGEKEMILQQTVPQRFTERR